jgi:hypothetical protein
MEVKENASKAKEKNNGVMPVTVILPALANNTV